MASVKARKVLKSGAEATGGEPLLSELLRLPTARVFPPLLGIKRGRGGQEGALADSTAAGGKLHPLLLGNTTGPAAQHLRAASTRDLLPDPTSLLLMEAASQLNTLVQQQLQRRMVRAARRSAAAAAHPSHSLSDSGSEEEGGEGECCPGQQGSEPGSGCCDSAASPRSMQGGLGTSTGTTAAASLQGSQPSSGPVSLRRFKRVRLERQYAIDLSGLCSIDGELVPLPPPDSEVLRLATRPDS